MSRNERWEVGERPSLDVRVPVGTVEVFAGDAGIVQLAIEASDADDYEVFKSGDRISVRHPSRWGRRGRNTRLVAHVPAGTDVEISSTSGEVRLVGRLGVVRVHTASGDIEVGDAARLDVTTASGAVSCGAVSGDAHVSSISGDCTLHGVAGRFDAALTSGDLRVDVCDGDVSIVSTSGAVRVGHCSGSDIAVRSISGDVRIGLPSGIRVDAEISTLSGRATLPDPAPASDLGDRRPVRLQLKTVSGDIRLERTT
jgi:Putative adhesin